LFGGLRAGRAAPSRTAVRVSGATQTAVDPEQVHVPPPDQGAPAAGATSSEDHRQTIDDHSLRAGGGGGTERRELPRLSRGTPRPGPDVGHGVPTGQVDRAIRSWRGVGVRHNAFRAVALVV